MQTLDNLLMNRFITLKQYLERMPAGYMPKQQELIDELKMQSGMQPATPQGTGMSTETTSSADIAPEGGPGNGALQRAINREGGITHGN